FVEFHPVGDALKIDRRDRAVLSVPAVELAAEALLALAELIASESAGRAGPALDAILDDDPVAFFPSDDSGPEARHFTRDVEPQDAWQRAGGRAARPNAEIRVIERRPANTDDDLARPRLRIRTVAEHELVRTPPFIHL